MQRLLAILLILLAHSLPAGAVSVTLRVVDEQGHRLPARVHVRDAFNQPYPGYPDSALMSHGAMTSYFYTPGLTVMDLPPGPSSITVVKGFEWRPVHLAPHIQGDTTLVALLLRACDLRSAGWFGGDTHVHTQHGPFDIPPLVPQMLHRLAQAEDLAQVYALDQAHEFTGAPHAVSTSDACLYYTVEYRNGASGHVALLGLKELRPFDCCYDPGQAYPLLTDTHEDWGPAWDEAMVLAHPGTGVPFFHDGYWPANGLGRELPVLAALGRLDALDLASYSNAPRWLQLDDWYALLNCGLCIPPSTGTDVSVSSYWHAPAGGCRVYVQETPGAPHDCAQWVEGLRAGRSFVTNLPLIPYFAVEGITPGGGLDLTAAARLQVDFSVRSILPVDTARIVVNGETAVVIELPGSPSGTSIDSTLSLMITEGSWIALSVTGRSETCLPAEPDLWAHTAPVYVRMDGERPRRTAAAGYFLDWIDDFALFVEQRDNWQPPENREEVMATLEEARRWYRSLFRLPAAPFALLQPAPGDSVSLCGPTAFAWEQAMDPEPGDRQGYLVTVSSDSLFADCDTIYCGPDCACSAQLVFAPGQPAWWRVRATDRGGHHTFGSPDPCPLLPVNQAAPGGVGDDPPSGLDPTALLPQLWPNPSAGAVWLRLPAAWGGGAEIAVIDPTGRCLLEHSVAASSGANATGDLVLRLWNGRDRGGRLAPGGCYWVRVRSDHAPGAEIGPAARTWTAPLLLLH